MQFRHNHCRNAQLNIAWLKGNPISFRLSRPNWFVTRLRLSRRATAMSPHLPQRETDALLGIGAVHFRFTR
jgi:hypothetical protein